MTLHVYEMLYNFGKMLAELQVSCTMSFAAYDLITKEL